MDGPTQSILCELVEIMEQELADVRADSRLVIEKELAGVRSDCLDAVQTFMAEARMESELHMSELRASVDKLELRTHFLTRGEKGMRIEVAKQKETLEAVAHELEAVQLSVDSRVRQKLKQHGALLRSLRHDLDADADKWQAVSETCTARAEGVQETLLRYTRSIDASLASALDEQSGQFQGTVAAAASLAMDAAQNIESLRDVTKESECKHDAQVQSLQEQLRELRYNRANGGNLNGGSRCPNPLMHRGDPHAHAEGVGSGGLEHRLSRARPATLSSDLDPDLERIDGIGGQRTRDRERERERERGR